MPRRPQTHRFAWRAALLALVLGLPACPARESPEPGSRPGGPSTAQWDVVELLRKDAAAERHASDGGGHARLLRDADQPPHATCGVPDHFRIVYEVGALGIATGGEIHFQVSPFWGWSTPQVSDPAAPGYTEIHSDPPELEWDVETLDQQLLGLRVRGRPLIAGDRVEIVYGAGPAGALPDRYAERGSRFWIAVDGNGDGVRRFLADSPTIDVRAGAADALRVTLPSVVRPGEEFRVRVALLDAWRNSGVAADGEIVVVDLPAGLEVPASVRLRAADGGRSTLQGVAREPGRYRIEVAFGELRARSNPMLVDPAGPRLLWGDLHGHSNFSDGTGVPEDYFVYARDVSGLDVVALTDHDHWGMLPLVERPERWQEIREQTQRFHEPGRFVTLLGFEWTNWIHGHRHVLYFADDGPLVDSLASQSDAPDELWAALEGHPALTIAHHPAGGPVATNWDFAPDPRFEPVVEIVSVHGSSESADSPAAIYDARPGSFVRDALDRGYRLGFVGSGDRHDGHPGDHAPERPEGGLVAILAEEHSREAVRHALQERRVYATNGPRIVLRSALAGVPMGGVLPAAEGERIDASLFVHAIGESALERIDLIRSGQRVDSLELDGRVEVTLQRDVRGLEAGEYLYLRVLQRDGGAAWSSPFFVGER